MNENDKTVLEGHAALLKGDLMARVQFWTFVGAVLLATYGLFQFVAWVGAISLGV